MHMIFGAIVILLVLWIIWKNNPFGPIKWQGQCSQCHVGNVEYEIYGSYDQWESQSKCPECGHEYDGLIG